MDFNEKVTKTAAEFLNVLVKNDTDELKEYTRVFRNDAKLATKALQICIDKVKGNPDQYVEPSANTLLDLLKHDLRYYRIAFRLNIRTFKESANPLDFRHAQLTMMRMLDGMYNMATLMRDWGGVLLTRSDGDKINKDIKTMHHKATVLRHLLSELHHQIKSATSIHEINSISWTIVDTIMKEHPYIMFAHVNKR